MGDCTVLFRHGRHHAPVMSDTWCGTTPAPGPGEKLPCQGQARPLPPGAGWRSCLDLSAKHALAPAPPKPPLTPTSVQKACRRQRGIAPLCCCLRKLQGHLGGQLLSHLLDLAADGQVDLAGAVLDDKAGDQGLRLGHKRGHSKADGQERGGQGRSACGLWVQQRERAMAAADGHGDLPGVFAH